MAKKSNIGVGAKLIFGFTAMILLLIGVGVVGYFDLTTIRRDLDNIFAKRMPSLDYLLQADRDLQQLLVAERSMIFTNAKSDDFKKLVEEYEANLKQAETRFNKYAALAQTAKEKELIQGFRQAWDEWLKVTKLVVESRKADTRKGRRLALDLTKTEASQKFEAMRDYIDKLTGIVQNQAKLERDGSNAAYRQAIIILAAITVLGLAVGVILAWTIGRGLSHRLGDAVQKLTKMADQISSAAQQVSSSSQHLAAGSSEQAASLEEVTSSMEEISSMVRSSSDNSNQADGLMKEAGTIVERAGRSMGDMADSMAQIAEAGAEIRKIVKSIDEISFQTNLLALNAAVEAARAGEAGMGFAVVADEVRSLAMRAAEAAKNTQTLVEQTVSRIGQGSELVEQTRSEFNAVAESAAKVGGLVSEIAAAANEQSQGIEQVSRAMIEMDKITQDTAASAEEGASAASQMDAQTGSLEGVVDELQALMGGRIESRRQTPAGRPVQPVQPAPRRGTQAKQQRLLAGPGFEEPFDDDF